MSAADDLRALSVAATPGPWNQWGVRVRGSYVHIWTADERIVARSVLSPDAEFIVWCRNHADALADLIDAARYIRTTGHGEKLTDMTTCRCGDPHPCPVLRTHDAIADLIDAAEALTQPAGWWTGVEQRQEHQLLDRRAVVRDALNTLDALEADRG